ncbi:hypothetical protein PRK78_005704 [Emydomyces testavorans]|uniref:Uncharacterized protein n=1 Tax=Emydomyces testavorans TaxID=2070801 RepID=A0AAF0DK42_9EURO|nr:hypothetical protein PRK78_005704 [Emydomyces testavorans]
MSQNSPTFTNFSLSSNPPSCINGKAVMTCRSCAGNPPRVRGEACTACQGYGFIMYACSNPQPSTANGSAKGGASRSAVDSRLLGKGGILDPASAPGWSTKSSDYRRHGDGSGGASGNGGIGVIGGR